MKRSKKILTWILGLAMVVAVLRPMTVSAAGTVYMTLKNNEVLTYGYQETKDMTVVLTNNTGADITNVAVTPALEANTDGWPFEIQAQDYTQRSELLTAGASAEYTYSFTARGDVEKNYYKLKFNLVYDGAEVMEKAIFVKTTPKPEEEKPEEKEEEKTEQEKTEEELAAEAAALEEAQRQAEEEAAAQEAAMAAMPEGGVSNGGVYSSSETKDPASVPRVIVTGFSTDPAEVKAGSNFKLIVHVKNTSTKTAVSNMLFDLQAPASGTETAAEAPAFLPVSGSSSIFLDKIGSGQTRDISIDMNARADLVQKPYSIDLSMKYEDADAAQYEGTSSLAVPVKQPARFEFSSLEISPTSIAVGEEANISGSLYNTGRIKLYNVKVKFTGSGIEESEIFVGNVDSGGTGAIDGMVTGKQEMSAEEKCKMIVSYEDDAGIVSTSEQEFTLEVTPEMIDTAEEVVMEPQKASIPVLPIAIGALVVIVGIIFFIIRRKKKKKMGEEEDLVDELDRLAEDEQ